MNKTDLISVIAEKLDVQRKEADKIVNTFFDTITAALQKGDKVQITGFGVFEVKKREAHMGRNPRTKENIEIPETLVPQFKAGKALKEAVNK
ncbi:MAG: HU family DNA-binding protein [Papillibacter sp.]|jgi:DNA-binding protein HU-beta|nr:HU family DNA-binding protein [Papillibacter sp.]